MMNPGLGVGPVEHRHLLPCTAVLLIFLHFFQKIQALLLLVFKGEDSDAWPVSASGCDLLGKPGLIFPDDPACRIDNLPGGAEIIT